MSGNVAGLTADELRIADEMLSGMLHPTISHTVCGLITKWLRFVEEVEGGYRASAYDYINDLGARTILERLARGLPRSIGATILRELSGPDVRLRAATEPLSGGPLVPTADEECWWYFRKPVLLVGELEEDLMNR